MVDFLLSLLSGLTWCALMVMRRYQIATIFRMEMLAFKLVIIAMTSSYLVLVSVV